MVDFGYDITDFKEIHPEYGTMQDFENLLSQAKNMGIHIIMDFVPNHSSNESDWFKLSVNRTKGYENYYVWADGKPDPDNPGKLLPPTNWLSVFWKSAWEYNPIRGQYYLHQFAVSQPDFNYRDPLLVNEMKDVLRFWLNKGVAGFRVDAVPHLFEASADEFGGELPDEPQTHLFGVAPEDYDYLQHIYTCNHELTYDMIYQWRDVLDEVEKIDDYPRVMLTEAYTDIKLIMKYYGTPTRNGAHLPVNLQFFYEIKRTSDARDIKFVIDMWMTYMPLGKTANWVNGNHDQKRTATRHGVERADVMNMLLLILPGAAITYQGEELAMTDGEVTWEETKDPQACNTDDPKNFYNKSRDPGRTPFHWDDSKNAGFSTGDKTWLPVAQNYKEVNLEAEKAAPRSHYKFYKDMADLRKHKAMSEGDYITKIIANNVLAIVRYIPDEEYVVGIINISTENKDVDLRPIHILPSTMNVYTTSIDCKLNKGDRITISKFKLSPNDAVVLTSF